jgi:hypothetical protein
MGREINIGELKMTVTKIAGFIQAEDEKEYKHECINCPTDVENDGTVVKCNAISTIDDKYFVCDDCSIDWKLLRIKEKDLPESEYEHRKIHCPLLSVITNVERNCDSTFDYWMKNGTFAPCTDCPIDWSKLRINKYKITEKIVYEKAEPDPYYGDNE